MENYMFSTVLYLPILIGCSPEYPEWHYGVATNSRNLWGPNYHSSGEDEAQDTSSEILDSGESEEAVASSEDELAEQSAYAENLVAIDQLGQPWSLHSQTSAWNLLIVGNMDNAATLSMLSSMESVLSEREIQGIFLMGRNSFSTPASTTDASQIADAHNIPVVLIDPSMELIHLWSDRNPPKAWLIDGDMQVQWEGFGYINPSDILNKMTVEE